MLHCCARQSTRVHARSATNEITTWPARGILSRQQHAAHNSTDRPPQAHTHTPSASTHTHPHLSPSSANAGHHACARPLPALDPTLPLAIAKSLRVLLRSSCWSADVLINHLKQEDLDKTRTNLAIANGKVVSLVEGKSIVYVLGKPSVFTGNAKSEALDIGHILLLV